MGLLKKANDNKKPLAVFKTQDNIDFSNNKKKNKIEDFLSEVNTLKPGFEYSKDLFDSLSVFFKINKGALLVLESGNSTFLPVTSKNIDITTTRHLRIDSTFFDKQFNYYNKIINISDKNIKLFKQYFSIREFAALNAIITIPFYHRGSLRALLLIIDPSDQLIHYAKEISLNSEKLTNKILKSRKPFNKLTERDSTEIKLEPIQILQNYIDNNKSEDITLLIFTINFTLLRDNIMKLLSNTDSYEISNNIIKSITQLINPSGKLLNISSEKYLLFYKIRTGKTPGLILHQINLAISSFFNISNTLPEIDAEMKSYPINECESAESMLEGII